MQERLRFKRLLPITAPWSKPILRFAPVFSKYPFTNKKIKMI
jgi:hypothetical protein